MRRPVWEDPLNLSGGKWIIRLRKGVADRLWEDLVLAVIGDQFEGIVDAADVGAGGNQDGVPPGEWPEVCGCTISVRQNEDIISLWNRHDGNAKSKEKIKCVWAKFLVTFSHMAFTRIGRPFGECSTFLLRR